MAKTIYYYNQKFNYIYTGNQQEGDRIATDDEVEYWNKYHSILSKDILKKLEENTNLYNKALQQPLYVNGYYAIAEWINTYTNTYTYAKKTEEEGNVASANIVVFNQTGKLENITISKLSDFEPYYNVVSKEWARLTDLRNKFIVEIQNSSDPREIEISYADKEN